MKFYFKSKSFHSRKCLGTCRLPKWRTSCFGLNDILICQNDVISIRLHVVLQEHPYLPWCAVVFLRAWRWQRMQWVHDDVIKWKHFPHHWPLCRGFTGDRWIDVFFDLRLNKRLSKQWWGWWFEMPSHPLWRHCNVYGLFYIPVSDWCWSRNLLTLQLSQLWTAKRVFRYICADIGKIIIDIFLAKLTFKISTACMPTTVFIGSRRDVLEKVSKFLRQKCLDPGGTRTPNLRIHAECSNHLSYRGQTFAIPCFGTLALVLLSPILEPWFVDIRKWFLI